VSWLYRTWEGEGEGMEVVYNGTDAFLILGATQLDASDFIF
jgi:hypothetical protein